MKGSILETIGSPLVRVPSPKGSIIAAKLESFNPGGSSKDRPALSMVEAAERDGHLEAGDRIVEATSGNTGIGLSIVCAARGYDLTIVMPSSKSEERRRLLRAYGADIELVEGDMEVARNRAADLCKSIGAVELDQFANRANVDAHYRSTSDEILADINGRRIDALVVTVGTGGTITGVGSRLREEFPDMEVVAVEPVENAVISTGIPGTDDFQGMGPGFISEILDVELIDTVETVSLPDAERECRRLARECGILVGQSSGAAMIASTRVAVRHVRPNHDGSERESEAPNATPVGTTTMEDEQHSLIVTIFPDSGERYLTTGTFTEDKSETTARFRSTTRRA